MNKYLDKEGLDSLIANVDNRYATKEELESGLYKKADTKTLEKYQPKGDYATNQRVNELELSVF